MTVPAVTVKVAEVAPCGTVTLDGTPAALVFELDSDTTAPPDGAADVNVTVPVPVCPLTIVLGLTVMPLNAAGGGLTVRPNVSLIPPYDTVRVTDVGLVTTPAPTENVAELAPCGTATLDGVVADPDEELMAIVNPPLGAADVSVTWQEETSGGAIAIGLQENPFRPGCKLSLLRR